MFTRSESSDRPAVPGEKEMRRNSMQLFNSLSQQIETFVAHNDEVRYWMHVGLVKLGGTKMSKSLGNLIVVHKLLKTYSADAIRLLLAGHHYRQGWEFALADMERAQRLT